MRTTVDNADTTVGVGEASAALGITRQGVHQLLRSGTLPGRQVYGLWRIERADLDRLVAERAKERGEGVGNGDHQNDDG